MDYSPLLQTLLGGGLAISGGLIGTAYTQWLQRKAERENLASAFHGEISALLSIIEKRGYMSSIEEDIEFIEKTGQAQFSHFRVTKSYFSVYEQNVGKIGILSAPLPEKIVLFYTFIFAILEDFEEMGLLAFEYSNVSELAERLNEMRDIAKNIISIGNEPFHGSSSYFLPAIYFLQKQR